MKKILLNRCLLSVVCLLLFLNNAKAICVTTLTSDTVNIACGDSFTFGGIAYYLPVIQTDTFRGIHGCDSVVTLYLSVTDTVNIYDTICSNDSLLFNGVYLDTAGVYTAHINPPNACDSTVILTLAVRPAPVVTFTWDSLIALHDVDSLFAYYGTGTGADTAFYCPQYFPNVFAFKGGNPPGGYYTGVFISNGTFNFGGAFNTFETYTYTYTDSNYCTQSASIVLMLTACSGIPEINSPYSLNLYPNPAHDYLTVEYNGFATNSQIEIVDVLGRVVKTERIKGPVTNTQVDIHALSSGLYFLRIENESGMESEGRFSVIR